MPDHRVRSILAAIGMAVLLAGCGAGGPTFAPTGECVVDGRAPGAYPQLEALVPRSINDRPSTSLDSGRNCSSDALGTLASHGVREVRFAGATWDESNGNGVSIAVLALPDQAFPVAWAEEFYLVGAQNGKHTGNIDTSRPTYAGVGPTFRLDTLNDLSFQTVVLWSDGDLVRVVIVATQVGPSASRTVHDARVTEAVGAAALAQASAPAPSGTGREPVLPSPT